MSVKVTVLSMVLVLICNLDAAIIPNGDFESPIGTAEGWDVWSGGGTVTATEHVTGGNPDGYVSLNAAAGTWAGWYKPTPLSFDALGVPAGEVITLQADIKNFSGHLNAAGLKLEALGGTLVEYGFRPGVTTNWETYSIQLDTNSDNTGLIFSLMNVPADAGGASVNGYDNARLIVDGKPLFPVPIVGGNLPVLDDVLQWVNPDPNTPGDTLTADVFILESDTLLVEDPNLGPILVDPGVVQVADDITAESVDLSDAGYMLQVDKYYYWAVHVTDPDIGVVEGFDWYFLATGDAPPKDISAGANQYVWLVDGTRQFTLTGTYTDDDKSPVVVEWTDLSNPLEQAPGTTVTINTPNAATTTVDVDGDGWFLFNFAVSDAIGSGSSTVNVGVYVDACAAAKADPADMAATYPDGHGDIDGDCDTDLADLALMAGSWLNCMSPKLGCL